MTKKLITVYGMTCEKCRTTIIHGLEKVQGIDRVSVNLPDALVEVNYNEDVISIDEVKAKITELGYDPM